MKTTTLIIASTALAASAHAQTALWEGAGAGDGANGRYWGDLANWSGVVAIPNGTGFTASLNNDANNTSGQRTLLLANGAGADTSFTIKSFSSSTATSNRDYRINNVSGGTAKLIFDSGVPDTAATFTVWTSAGSVLAINAGLQLNSNLDALIRFNSATTTILASFNGVISGAGGFNLTTLNSGTTYRAGFNATNTYIGNTTIANGHLVVGATGTLGQSDTILSGAGSFLTLESANALNDSFGLTVATGATVNLNFSGVDTVGGLTIGGTALGAGTYDAAALSLYGASFTGIGQLSIVPEPSSFATLAGLSAVLLTATRRRLRG